MLAKEIVRFANSRGFLDYSVTNVLNHRSLLAHTFSNQCFCSHYPISPLPHKYLHTLKQWDSRLTHSPLCCFCSLAEWEKGICFTVGFWLLFPLEGFFPFCLHFSIIFFNRMLLTLLLKLPFQFIALLCVDFLLKFACSSTWSTNFLLEE